MNLNQHPDNKFQERLPKHQPDSDLWQHIENKLDALDADTLLTQKLNELPVHTPDPGMWRRITSRLDSMQYARSVVRWTSAAAAALILLFVLTRTGSFDESVNKAPETAATTAESKSIASIENTTITRKPAISDVKGKNKTTRHKLLTSGMQQLASVEQEPAFAYLLNDIIDESLNIIPDSDWPADQAYEPAIAADINHAGTGGDALPRYYTPKEREILSGNQNFALAMNYLPENIGNGNGNSLFHNIDLSAAYSSEKFRVNTSIGLAYNQEHYSYEMNYDELRPVTAVGPTGNLDTVMYTVNNVETDYSGVLDHRYLTYNLGIGRKLFSAGRISSWINATAGFAYKIDNTTSHESTANTLKIKYNAIVRDVSETQSAYNRSNISLATGIDFNYKIIERLSLTFAPTSRWYFKPVFSQNNKAADEFTMGFRTGLKLDF